MNPESLIPKAKEIPIFEEVSMDTCVEYTEKILTQGIQSYFENVETTQAIHRARELRYVLPMLELSQRNDLKNSLQESIRIYIEAEHTSTTVYLVMLYLKQILFQIEHEGTQEQDDSLDIQKLGAFSYGRVFDDPTLSDVDIKVVDLLGYVGSIEKMKKMDGKFAEYMNSAPAVAQRSIPATLNKVLYYPGLLSDGTSPQMNLPWKSVEKSDLTLSVQSEVSDEDMKDFIALKSKGMNEVIQKEFNFDLSHYTLPEQFQFLSYIKTASFEDVASLQKVFQNIPHTQIMEVFSALEGADSSLVKIFTDAYNTLTPGEFQAILSVFHRALIHVKTFDETFSQKTDINPDDVAEIHHNFQARLLKRISNSLKNNLQNGVGEGRVTDWIFEQDKQLSRDISKDVMRTLIDMDKDVDVEVLKNAKISVHTMSELSEEDLAKEAERYYHVWSVLEQKPVFSKVLDKSFRDRVADRERLKKSRFYVFSINDERVASIIIEDKEDGTKGASALYVDEAFRNGSLAKPFVEEVYKKEKKDAVINLQGYPTSPSAQIAFDNGFVGTNFEYKTFSEDSNTDIIPVLTMVYDERLTDLVATEYIDTDMDSMTSVLNDIFSKKDKDSQVWVVSYEKERSTNKVRLGIVR